MKKIGIFTITLIILVLTSFGINYYKNHHNISDEVDEKIEYTIIPSLNGEFYISNTIYLPVVVYTNQDHDLLDFKLLESNVIDNQTTIELIKGINEIIVQDNDDKYMYYYLKISTTSEFLTISNIIIGTEDEEFIVDYNIDLIQYESSKDIHISSPISIGNLDSIDFKNDETLETTMIGDSNGWRYSITNSTLSKIWFKEITINKSDNIDFLLRDRNGMTINLDNPLLPNEDLKLSFNGTLSDIDYGFIQLKVIYEIDGVFHTSYSNPIFVRGAANYNHIKQYIEENENE